MYKSLIFIGIMGVNVAVGAAVAQPDDPLTRPIAPEFAARWLGAQEPLRIHGNTYLVGFEGLSVALIDTGDGLILIDGAVPQAVGAIEANIRKLGFRVEDIRYILSTEPHYDHAGGIAALARDSGATVIASAAAADVLRSGRADDDDPQHDHLPAMPAISNVRVLGDGERLRHGNTIVTARATPGHTAGSMSWTWRSCEDGTCHDVVFASSLSPVSADGYRFSNPAHAATVAAFRRTFALVRAMPCDVLISAHPDQSGGDARLRRFRAGERPSPLVDPSACRAYADRAEQRLDARLAEEAQARR